MEYEVVITKTAEDGLVEILNYLEQNNWHEAAEKLVHAFHRLLSSLARYPLMYPQTESRADLRKAILRGRTLVYYSVVDSKVLIRSVQDGRRDGFLSNI